MVCARRANLDSRIFILRAGGSTAPTSVIKVPIVPRSRPITSINLNSSGSINWRRKHRVRTHWSRKIRFFLGTAVADWSPLIAIPGVPVGRALLRGWKYRPRFHQHACQMVGTFLSLAYARTGCSRWTRQMVLTFGVIALPRIIRSPCIRARHSWTEIPSSYLFHLWKWASRFFRGMGAARRAVPWEPLIYRLEPRSGTRQRLAILQKRRAATGCLSNVTAQVGRRFGGLRRLIQNVVCSFLGPVKITATRLVRLVTRSSRSILVTAWFGG